MTSMYCEPTQVDTFYVTVGCSRYRVAAGQGQGPRVRAGMSLEGRVRVQLLGPQARAGPNLEARP